MIDNILGQTLKQYREQSGKSIAELALELGIDRSYLYRLETQEGDWLNRPLEGGPPKQPHRDLIIGLGIALGLDLNTTDELLLIAGYAPIFRTRRTK